MTYLCKLLLPGAVLALMMFLMPTLIRADPATEAAVKKAYNLGYQKGYADGLATNLPGGGGAQNDIILTTPKDGGFSTGGGTVSMQKPKVGFLWDGTAKTWQAYKLGGEKVNTVTPGTGLPIAEWTKQPALLEKSGVDPQTVTPKLQEMGKELSDKFPESNVFVMPPPGNSKGKQ